MTTKVLKSLIIIALLGLTSARADQTMSVPNDGTATGSFQVSEVRCQLIEGQVRCTFG